jgi:type IV pilus assembly protein PilW
VIRRSSSQRGFSLVELMVAISLSLVLLAGVLSVLYSSRVTYRENDRVARLQENGRAALELMLRDMRAGGFHGCAQTAPLENTLNSPATLLWNFAAPVQGYESTGAGTWSPALDALVDSPLNGSDVIAIRTTRSNLPTFQTNGPMAATTSDITVDRDATDTLPTGQPVLISDCQASAVFAISTFTGAGTTATLAHASAAGAVGVGPGNSSTDLKYQFTPGAQVVPLDTIVYYIRASDTVRAGGVRNPALWRIIGSGAPQELIEGIEAMQIRYGVDTDGDRLVNSYVTADAVANWSRVISVSFALLIRSVEPDSPPSPQTFSMMGTTVGPFNDRYQRTLYTTTVTLRNTTS